MTPPGRYVFISPRTIGTALALAAFAVLVGFFAYATIRVLTWIMFALFLALALDHVVVLLERRLPRTVAVLATFLAAVLALGGIGWAIVPTLVDEATSFVRSLPDLVESLTQGRGPLGFLEREFDIVERMRRYVGSESAGGALGLSGPVLAAVEGVLATVVGTIAVAFLTLFMLLHGPRWKAAALDLLPDEQRVLWQRLSAAIYETIGGWVVGAAALSLVAGASATALAFALGAPYPLVLGLIVALLDPIPFIGATIAAAIVSFTLLATQGLLPALVFAGFAVAYQQVVENHILIPLVYARTVQLDALGILIAVLLGGELAGVVGAIAAVPIGGSLKAVVTEVLSWRRKRAIEVTPGALTGGEGTGDESERAAGERV